MHDHQIWVRTRGLAFLAVVIGLSLVVWSGAPHVAGQTYESVGADSVGAGSVGADSVGAGSVERAESGAAANRADSLALTGSDSAMPELVIGIVVLLAGIALVIMSHRKARRVGDA